MSMATQLNILRWDRRHNSRTDRRWETNSKCIVLVEYLLNGYDTWDVNKNMLWTHTLHVCVWNHMHVGMQTFCQLEIKKKYKKSCANYTIFFPLCRKWDIRWLCVCTVNTSTRRPHCVHELLRIIVYFIFEILLCMCICERENVYIYRKILVHIFFIRLWCCCCYCWIFVSVAADFCFSLS